MPAAEVQPHAAIGIALIVLIILFFVQFYVRENRRGR